MCFGAFFIFNKLTTRKGKMFELKMQIFCENVSKLC